MISLKLGTVPELLYCPERHEILAISLLGVSSNRLWMEKRKYNALQFSCHNDDSMLA